MIADSTFSHTIIGSGVIGSALIGKLLDLGFEKSQILWIDTNFSLEEFAKKIPSDNRITAFDIFRYFYSCPSFEFINNEQMFELSKLNPETICNWQYILKPLDWVTKQLKQKVTCATMQKILINKHLENMHLLPFKDVYSEKVIVTSDFLGDVDHESSKVYNMTLDPLLVGVWPVMNQINRLLPMWTEPS